MFYKIDQVVGQMVQKFKIDVNFNRLNIGIELSLLRYSIVIYGWFYLLGLSVNISKSIYP